MQSSATRFSATVRTSVQPERCARCQEVPPEGRESPATRRQPRTACATFLRECSVATCSREGDLPCVGKGWGGLSALSTLQCAASDTLRRCQRPGGLARLQLRRQQLVVHAKGQPPSLDGAGGRVGAQSVHTRQYRLVPVERAVVVQGAGYVWSSTRSFGLLRGPSIS